MAKDLAWAIKGGDVDEVKAMLTDDNVNLNLENGRKPLHVAADFGHPELIKFLVSNGADINALDKHGFSPLMTACLEGHPSCVKVLLEMGAQKPQKSLDDLDTSTEIKEMLK
ncbi:myotrophin [Kryptolebias marmoratus]|uniref:Myotrophin n=1 Tax=Kryptolebias marmoratus TaxID=37003 RepID=A0A3Q3FSF8_KRYMA|nr:myotrophin [Kryptolebias marmoratus]